jgi:hypothetical protein
MMRKRISEFLNVLPATEIDLGSDARLPGDYAAGHALGASYSLADLPDETSLRTDLQAAVQYIGRLRFAAASSAMLMFSQILQTSLMCRCKRQLRKRAGTLTTEKLNAIVLRQEMQRGFTGQGARRAISIFVSAMGTSAAAL